MSEIMVMISVDQFEETCNLMIKSPIPADDINRTVLAELVKLQNLDVQHIGPALIKALPDNYIVSFVPTEKEELMGIVIHLHQSQKSDELQLALVDYDSLQITSGSLAALPKERYM